MKYRLGLDLGSNSIGWCALELGLADGDDDASSRYRPQRILDAGVRILTPNEEAGRDPQSKASLAAARRMARATRRRRDRFLRRRTRLMETLVAAGLMPQKEADRKELETLDPYWLRAAALDGRLEPCELGRAIFHLNQRRGFKSNRLADADDPEKGATKVGMAQLEEALEAANARTLGEFLAQRHKRDKKGKRRAESGGYAVPEPVRFRPTSKGAKNLYELYPARALIERELDSIWTTQKQYHPQLTDELLRRLKRIIVEQRPLKKPIVGRCTLRPEIDVVNRFGLEIDMGERAPKAHPLFQRFRILQEIAQLRLVRPGQRERFLTVQEASAVAAKLMTSSSIVPFEKLREAARLPDGSRFNYENAGRKGLKPDETAARLGARKCFGQAWRSLSRERQIEVVERLLEAQEPEPLVAWLRSEFDLDADAAEAISGARLPYGHGQLGRGILQDLVTAMENRNQDLADPATGEITTRPLTYDEAVKAVDVTLHHSHLRPEGTETVLPYYGTALVRHVISKPDAPEGSQELLGRVPNPTVHIGLNQLRKIVNALIREYGPPTEIVIELARELKLNQKRKDEIAQENRDNAKKNEDRVELLKALNIANTHDARLRLRLFDELPAEERVCVFSGESISMERLFDGSIEIEHVLPYSQTLDDSFMNKVLCTTRANRFKGRRPPAEAWHDDELRKIAERAERLLPKKAWRFQPGAMERFAEDGGFLARQLTDTQHMSRMARTYLEHVCGQVWGPPGRLTAMLRARWGLNGLLPDHNYGDTGQEKNRKDHRHHVIDAFVVGCTDRGLLYRMARASGQAENFDRLYPRGEFPEPYDGYRDDLKARLDTLVVSHKPDHGLQPGHRRHPHATSGQLHEETAYGLVDEEIEGKRYNAVFRKPISQLTDGEISRIRDRRLREDVQTYLANLASQDSGSKLSTKERIQRLTDFGQRRNIRRVRILKIENSVRAIYHTNSLGEIFAKGYVPGDNYCIEIYELPNGKWVGEAISVYDANQQSFDPSWHTKYPDARLKMRVHRGDLIAADFGGGKRIYRVCQLDAAANRIKLARHHEAGSLKERHDLPSDQDPFRYEMKAYSRLKAAAAHLVRVDVLGRVSAIADVRE